MSFLQSLFLVGLAAAAIPVLIHLLNRPRARVERFSTLEFIRRLHIRKSKRLRVRELLLLALRVLLIALVALAFARPALQGALAGRLGGQARSSVCVVLDVSHSMSYADGESTLLDRAKERARQIVGLLDEGDEAALVLASDAAEIPFLRPTHDFRIVEAAIERAVATSRGTDLLRAAREAVRLLEGTAGPNREVFIVTDMQRTGFGADREAWEELAPSPCRFFFLPVGGEERPNRAVTGAELFEPRRLGETVKIRGTVANHGDEPAEALVTLLIDDERRGTTTVRVEPLATGSVVFSALVKETGTHRGEIRLDEDQLTGDDSFYFTIDRPERLEVLLVGPAEERGLFFLRSALEPAGGEGLLRVRTTEPEGLRSIRLAPFHALFLVGVPSLGAPELAALESYVRGGGGLVIVPGDGIDFGAYNTEILGALFGPARIAPSLVERRDRPVGVDRFEEAHPLFQIFRQGLDQALREIRVVRHLDVAPGDLASLVARLSDGSPLLVEAKRGSGRAFLWTIGHDLSWSDLPTRPVYLPILHETVRYLYGGGALFRTSIEVGETYRREIAAVEPGDEFTCATPMENVVLQPRDEGDHFVLVVDGTTDPGFYRITGGGLDESFAVNAAADESDLASLGPAEVPAVVGALPHKIVGHERRLERPILEARYGRELWWELLILALAIALVEMLLARTRRSAAVVGEV